MIGNQVMINSQIFEHEDNPVKEDIKGVDALSIIYAITDEWWKEWRVSLTHAQNPHIYHPGFGEYNLRYGKSKVYLRKMLKKIKAIKRNHPDKYLVEGNKWHDMYQADIKRFRNTWYQVDKIKLEVVRNLEIWKQKKIAKYGDKAIIQ